MKPWQRWILWLIGGSGVMGSVVWSSSHNSRAVITSMLAYAAGFIVMGVTGQFR